MTIPSQIAARHGWRALVTRPRSEAAGLAAMLETRGIAPVIEPLIEVYYRDVAPPDLAGLQAVLCTSANGVRALARLSPERSVPLLAVGDATAARARQEGFIAVESAAGDVDDLARLAAARLRPEAGPLVHVAGRDIAGNLAGQLRAAGFTVDRQVLYEARPVASLSAGTLRLLAAGIVDFALFFSPRTAATFARLAERAELGAALGAVTAVSISAAADAAVAGLRWRARHIAAAPNQDALLAVLDDLAAQSRKRVG